MQTFIHTNFTRDTRRGTAAGLVLYILFHIIHFVSYYTFCFIPTSQGTHAVAPLPAWYLPAGQDGQDKAAVVPGVGGIDSHTLYNSKLCVCMCVCVCVCGMYDNSNLKKINKN
jgi:hypothetical protein